MKITVITVVRNAQDTIADTIKSVASQNYSDVEHIIIDGASTDKTLDVIESLKGSISCLVSEPDDGLYDAMNKGIGLATGDVIGMLNADDVYQNDAVLQQVADAHRDKDLDACYANLVYVQKADLTVVTRHWFSRKHKPGLCFTGWMPAHPTLYLKKRVYHQVGFYNTNLNYQADLEFCARAFDVHKISSRFIPMLWVRMRLGGVTNNKFTDIVKGNWESYQALKELGLKRNPVSYFTIKLASKIPQYLPLFLSKRLSHVVR